jgi:hypothetical protein
LTYLGTVFVIGASFGIIYGINIGKSQVDNMDNDNKNTARFLSFVCSFVIVITNKLLITIVRSLSIKEKHETYTEYNLSVAFKLTFCRFINTAIVPMVVNITADRWSKDGGLVSDVFSIMISISFIEPLQYLLDVGALISYFKKQY